MEEGKCYATGKGFRARVEARQRAFRANVLGIASGKYGHWLTEADAMRGMNFRGRAFEAAKVRAEKGKGVEVGRTFGNMLSSQAMCFNVFGHLAGPDGDDPAGLAIAAEALREFVPGLESVRAVHIEYTPPPDVFGDQSSVGGVDCDVLIEYRGSRGPGLLAIETKFVEPDFSVCTFRRRASSPGCNGRDICPEGTIPGEDFSGCLYAARKGYAYWDWSSKLGTLQSHVLGRTECPFGGALWQLWVNHTLVHAESARRDASEAYFVVCAPKGNAKLTAGGKTIDSFRGLLANPKTMLFIGVEDLIASLAKAIPLDDDRWSGWAKYLQDRYAID